MASITQNAGVAPHLLSPIGNQVAVDEHPQVLKDTKPRDIVTTFNYYKDPEDGSAPAPTYSNKPESYERPQITQKLVVHDIRGSEDKYTLDTEGFQIVKHESKEKDFVDEEHIKAVYYPETEELLKKTSVSRNCSAIPKLTTTEVLVQIRSSSSITPSAAKQ